MIITNSSEDEIKPDSKAKAVFPELQRRIETLEKMVYASKEILNLEEAARFIGVTRSQLYKLTHAHAIPYFKPSGNLVYFERTELLKWLRQNPVRSQAQLDEEAGVILNRLAVK